MRRGWFLFIAVVMGLAFAQQPLKVALIVAQGGLGDLSYNDLAYAGLQKAAKDFAGKVTVRIVQSQDIVSQGESVLSTAAKSGFDLVINLEYGAADALKRVAGDFPNTKFAMFNLEIPGPNIVSVLFQEQEGSYLAGALAAIATSKSNVPGINPQKVIGVIGGTKSPGIDKFIIGYAEGAKSVDPDIKVLVSYSNDFGDPAKGKELAKAMFDQGADIVYQVAGGTGQGVIDAAKESGHFAIGVDSDQDYLAPGRVLTSMIKRADTAVYNLIKQLLDGKLKGGNTQFFGLASTGVGISPLRYTKSIFSAADLAKVDQMRRNIISGKIKPTDITTVSDPAAVYKRLGL